MFSTRKKKEKIERAASLILGSQKIVGFTGAGACTDSGVPDFRGIGHSYWTKYDPKDFLYQQFIDSERSRKIFWEMEQQFYELVLRVQPNEVHYAYSELEHKGKLLAVITQNVDRLHQRAQSSEEKVIEIHGSIFSVSCLHCYARFSRDHIYQRIKGGGIQVPYCDLCGGILKSNTIAFGQPMPLESSLRSLQATMQSDLFIVIGASLLVQPAAYLVIEAKRRGAKVLIINLMATPYDIYADLVIYDNAQEAIIQIMELVRKRMI